MKAKETEALRRVANFLREQETAALKLENDSRRIGTETSETWTHYWQGVKFAFMDSLLKLEGEFPDLKE